MVANSYRNRSQWFITRDWELGEDYSTSHDQTYPLVGRGVVASSNLDEAVFPASTTSDHQGLIVIHSMKGTAGDTDTSRIRVRGLPVSVLRNGFFPEAIAGSAISADALLAVDEDGFWVPASISDATEVAALRGVRAIAREAAAAKYDLFLIEIC